MGERRNNRSLVPLNPFIMSKRSKSYRAAKEMLEEKDFFTIDEAIPLLLKTAQTKFDSSCEIHLNLGINPKHADQIVRGTMKMPHGTGKKYRIVALVSEDKEKEAKDAGAVEAGGSDLIEKISKGWLDFDIMIAMPSMMKQIGKVAKILGQQRLMPSPKAGTVTDDIGQTINDIMKGKVEYRNDKQGNLHNIFGKVSFGDEKLKENLKSYLKAVVDAKPSGVKGVYIKSITLSTSMSPGIKVDVQEARA